MRKVLIAHNSEDFAHALYLTLREQFHVTVCFDGNCASELVETLKPEILILDLMLPYQNGLEILEQLHPNIPPIILATTSHHSESVLQSPISKHIDHIFLSTCSIDTIAKQIYCLLDRLPPDYNFTPLQNQIVDILLALQIPTGLNGFLQLKVGIPLFALDPAQKLSKELYPAIAKFCGFGSGEQVERSIRSAIEKAWETGNREYWEKYFPHETECPPNKVFISRLAALLKI